MSVNIKIELAAATVLAIQEAAKGGEIEAIRTVRALTDRAVLDAVKKLPYDLTPKIATAKKLKHSFHSSSTSEATRPKKQRKTLEPFHFFVKTNSGKTMTVEVTNESTIDEVEWEVQAHGRIPPEQQRLLFLGRQMEDGRTIEEENILPDSRLHLVLRLCRS